MSTTPDDPFASRPEDGRAQQPNAQPQGWGEAPQPGQQYTQPQYPQPQYAPPVGAPTGPRPGTEKNWMNITSLVLSLAGLITGITAIGGIILGHMGRSAAKKGEADNGGLGLAGLITGYVLVAIGILITIAIFAFGGWLISECGGDNPASWCTDSTMSITVQDPDGLVEITG